MVLPAAVDRMTPRMRAAFRSLTVTQQQVFVLYAVDHQSAAAAGHKLGMPAEAVRSIFTGACQRMALAGIRHRAVTR